MLQDFYFNRNRTKTINYTGTLTKHYTLRDTTKLRKMILGIHEMVYIKEIIIFLRNYSGGNIIILTVMQETVQKGKQ